MWDYDAIHAFVAKYRKVCNQATPAPWWRDNPDNESQDGRGEQDYICAKDPEGTTEFPDMAIITCDSGVYGPGWKDAEFICESRKGLPEALDLIEWLLTHDP